MVLDEAGTITSALPAEPIYENRMLLAPKPLSSIRFASEYPLGKSASPPFEIVIDELFSFVNFHVWDTDY